MRDNPHKIHSNLIPSNWTVLVTPHLLETLGALHVEGAVQVELVVELADLVVLPRRLRPGQAAKEREE